MAEPLLLGLHVPAVAEVRRGLQRHQALDNDAFPGQRPGLGGVVGEHAGASDPGGLEDLHGLEEVTAVDWQAQPAVGLYGVVALVLQHVGPELWHQPDTPTLVAGGVHQRSPALGDDPPHCQLQLGTAVAAERAERVAGEAGGMQADQHVAAVPDLAVDEQQVHVARGALEHAQVELSGPGRQDEVSDFLGLRHVRPIAHLSVCNQG